MRLGGRGGRGGDWRPVLSWKLRRGNGRGKEEEREKEGGRREKIITQDSQEEGGRAKQNKTLLPSVIVLCVKVPLNKTWAAASASAPAAGAVGSTPPLKEGWRPTGTHRGPS